MLSLLFSLFLWAQNAQAEISNNPLWNCQINSNINGAPWFYLRYGQDLWSGNANALCSQNEIATYIPLQISIATWGTGVGVTYQSTLKIEFQIFVRQLADLFQSYPFQEITSLNLTSPDRVRFDLLAGDSNFRINFSLIELKGSDFSDSSRYGTLSIQRPSGKTPSINP